MPGCFVVLLAVSSLASSQGGDRWYQALQTPTALSSEQWWQFHREGYVQLDGFFGGDRFHLIEDARNDIDQMWRDGKKRQYQHVYVQETPQLKGNEQPQTFPVRLSKVPKSARESPYRIYFANKGDGINPWRNLVNDPALTKIVAALVSSSNFPQAKGPNTTGADPGEHLLVFEWGTQQGMHLDTWYTLGARTHGVMVAAWVALDNVTADNGPLLYVPGSHMIMPEVRSRRCNDYSTCRATPRSAEHRDVERDIESRSTRYIEGEIERHGLKRVELRATAGDVFIWHEMLYHGGAPIRDLTKRRRSCVSHYVAKAEQGGA